MYFVFSTAHLPHSGRRTFGALVAMLSPPEAPVPVEEGVIRTVTLEVAVLRGSHMPKMDNMWPGKYRYLGM